MASVWYLGRSNTRSISASEWAAAGISGATTTVWNAANGYSIPADQFTEAQLTLLEAETGFDTDAPDGPRTSPVITPEDKVTMADVVELLNDSGLSAAALNATIGDQIEAEVPAVMAASPTITTAATNAVNARVAAERLQKRDSLPVNARDEGATGNGTTDDGVKLQAAIDLAVSQGRALYIPAGVYKIATTLTIPDHLDMYGDGTGEVWNPVKTGAPIDYSSYFTATDIVGGTIILQTQAGWDAIKITGRGKNVSLHDFGIRFADAIKFSNTGHGINVAPPANPYDATSKDHGVFGAIWSNLKVFGHDGNHYAYNVVNPLGCHFDNLNSFGGGCLRLFTDSSLFFYGNSTITNLYGAVIDAGTADGIYLGGNGGGVGGTIQLLEWHRPQIWLANITENVPGTTAPTNAQLLLNADPNRARRMSWIDPDFENNVSSTVRWPIYDNKIVNGSQAGNPHTSNTASPPTNTASITNGTYYQNTQGCDVLYHMHFKLNPDATTAATVNVKLSDNGTVDGLTVLNQSVPAGGPIGVPLSHSFIIPAGKYMKLTTTRASWNDFALQKVQY
jgi:hypothetical protein